jgi:hypothetical protein
MDWKRPFIRSNGSRGGARWLRRRKVPNGHYGICFTARDETWIASFLKLTSGVREFEF